MANFAKLCVIVLFAGNSGFQLSAPRDQHLAVSADGTVDAPILAQTASGDSHQARVIGPQVEEFMHTLSSFESLLQKWQGPVGSDMTEELASSHEVLAQVTSQVQGKDDGSAATIIGTNAESILDAIVNLKKIAHEFRGRREKLEHTEADNEVENEADQDGEEAEEDEEQDQQQSEEGEQVEVLPELVSNVSDDDRVEEFLQSLQSARDAVHEMRITMDGKSENGSDVSIALSQVAEAPHPDDIIEDFLHEHGLPEAISRLMGEKHNDTDKARVNKSNSSLQIGGPANDTQGTSTK